MRSKIYCPISPWDPMGSWIQYMYLVERSSGIIDPTLGSMDMSAAHLDLTLVRSDLTRHVGSLKVAIRH